MKFSWDETKSQPCFRERGFDFEYAIAAFFDPNRLVCKIIVGIMVRIGSNCMA